MHEDHIRELLEAVRAGRLAPDRALQELKSGPFRSGVLEFAHVDHHRRMRQGLGEVIYGEAKPIEHIIAIAAEVEPTNVPLLITRLQPEKLAALQARFPDGRANAIGRTFMLHAPAHIEVTPGLPHVAIVAAGTSDLPVAEEAAEVCLAMGVACARFTDVGVAGIHRLLARVEALQAATSLVVIAGMEGALPSVVAGVLGRPVFAVPTSVGYGASFGGISALLGMLNSCAAGVSVVNIDNGFSAAYAACQVVRAVQQAAKVLMNRILFLESVAGVAGDTLAAAFVDAGLVTAAELAQIPAQLGFSDVKVETKSMAKATITATHLRVVTGASTNRHPLGHSHGHGPSPTHDHGPEGHGQAHEDQHLVPDAPAHHEHTHYVDIDKRIRDSQLAAPVRNLARKIFQLLAEAEAAAHGYKVADVAFHEIGSIDSIVDVVMAAYCVTKVGPVRFVASPIRPGRGVVNIAHGSQPIPPPASARLLAGLPVAPTPQGIKRENVELSTPTGIAILKALAPEFATELPTGTVKAVGMGAGTMDLGTFPNVFRLFLLEASTAAVALPYESDRVVEICCNIDDDTGEHLGWIGEQLLAQGALDVTLTPATGKKSRPMVLLSVLAPEERWSQLADWLLRQSTTFGLRYQTWSRLKLARKFEPRTVSGRKVTYKIGLTTDGKVLKEKPEFDETL